MKLFQRPLLSIFLVLMFQEQSKLVWKLRDQLKDSLSKAEMHQLLSANNQDIPKGEDNVSEYDLWGSPTYQGSVTLIPEGGV